MPLMTEGNIAKQLILFALPLLVGNLFQQLYNTVDSIVVGNYVSKTALAAVGSTDCIINTIIGFFSGLSTGAGVVISHNFGSRDDKALHCTVHTTIALTLVLAVFFTIAGLFLSPFFLRLMDTPEDVLPESSRLSDNLFCWCFWSYAIQHGGWNFARSQVTLHAHFIF